MKYQFCLVYKIANALAFLSKDIQRKLVVSCGMGSGYKRVSMLLTKPLMFFLENLLG